MATIRVIISSMGKILVIPDMHLKAHMLDMAESILGHERIVKIIILGDLLDDFYARPEAYEAFWQKFMSFYETNKDRIVLLYGNHEVAYLLGRPVTGNTRHGEKYARRYAKLSPKIVFVAGKIVFSHAGVFDEFLSARGLSDSHIPEAIALINSMPLEDVWTDDSPLWARPQLCHLHTRGEWPDYLQVVGHTPLQRIEKAGDTISVDVFSTNWGKKYGEEKMIIIDTETGEFKIVS